MPLFPLGVTYVPYGTEVLSIFEPRYRAMYNDILFSGARRFLVCNTCKETGRIAEVGAIFYLDNLKEVSEQTKDRVKYIATHSVVGRATLKKVLNPKAAVTRETYLQAEVAELVDVAGETAAAEAELKEVFESLIKTQESVQAEPRFTEDVIGQLQLGLGTGVDDKGLWGSVGLWQEFLKARVQVIGRNMQLEIQTRVAEYFEQHPEEQAKVQGKVDLGDLPSDLSVEIRAIQRRGGEELEASDSDPYGLQFQALLQAESHEERLGIFRRMLEMESKRLSARATLQSLFKEDC